MPTIEFIAEIKFLKEVIQELTEYLKHDSWRCDYYQLCHCGLNDLTDKLKLPRVPFEGKFPKK